MLSVITKQEKTPVNLPKFNVMPHCIDILSPGTGCRKTRHWVDFLEKFVRKHGIDAEIHIITDMKIMLKYRTWILPAVFVNGEPVSRGYRPSEKNLFEKLGRFPANNHCITK
jgi:hypothetical protein